MRLGAALHSANQTPPRHSAASSDDSNNNKMSDDQLKDDEGGRRVMMSMAMSRAAIDGACTAIAAAAAQAQIRSIAGLTPARHWRVAELLDVGGGGGPLVHFVDWPSQWDQRVAVGSVRLQPLRTFSRGYTGPPSKANKEGVKEDFERRVAEKMAQLRDEVASACRTQSESDEKESGAVAENQKGAASSFSSFRSDSFGPTSFKPTGWELKDGQWVRRVKGPLAADVSDGAGSSSLACSLGTSLSPSPTRTPFNSPSVTLLGRRKIPAGEMLGSDSGSTSLRMWPSQLDTKDDAASGSHLSRRVKRSVSRFCSALKETLRAEEDEDSDSSCDDGGSSNSDGDSSSSSDISSEDSELQRLHAASSDGSSSSVEEPISGAESESDRESAAEESDDDQETASQDQEDDEDESDGDESSDEEEDGGDESDDHSDSDESYDSSDDQSDAEEEEEDDYSKAELQAKRKKAEDDAIRQLGQFFAPLPLPATSRDGKRLSRQVNPASIKTDEQKSSRGKESGSSLKAHSPRLVSSSAKPIAATPAISSKPAPAAAPSKAAFVPPPMNLATMARQARKIVAQCPPARVCVLGAQGSGRSSLINLLCSATNPAPSDPHLSTRAHVQRSATTVTTRIKTHALNAQIALVDAGGFSSAAALDAFLEGKLPDGCRDSEAAAHLAAVPSASRAISGALLVWSAKAAGATARQEIEMAQLLRAVSDRGIPFVLVVTHADSVIPLSEMAAPSSSARPLYEHAQMQPLIADISARTGVNANQIFPVANYCSQRRRQFPLERNGVLALAQLAKQIREGHKFATAAAATTLRMPSSLLQQYRIAQSVPALVPAAQQTRPMAEPTAGESFAAAGRPFVLPAAAATAPSPLVRMYRVVQPSELHLFHAQPGRTETIIEKGEFGCLLRRVQKQPIAHTPTSAAQMQTRNKSAEKGLLLQQPLIQLKAPTGAAATEQVQQAPTQTVTQAQAQAGASLNAIQPPPLEVHPRAEQTTSPAASDGTAISLQLHLRTQSDDGELKEAEAEAVPRASPEQPAAGSLSETSGPTAPIPAAATSSASLIDSPSSPHSTHSAHSDASGSGSDSDSDSSWQQCDSPSPADHDA